MMNHLHVLGQTCHNNTNTIHSHRDALQLKGILIPFEIDRILIPFEIDQDIQKFRM